MNPTELKRLILSHAESNGYAVGICGVSPFDFDAAADTPFMNCAPEKRINPLLSMPSAQSIVVISLPYPARPEPPRDNVPRGLIAAFAVPEDYHKRVKRVLRSLSGELGSHEFKLYSDTGPLPEKVMARDCGLGHIGRNSLLISPVFGSMHNLGYMLTSLLLPPDSPIGTDCGACRSCVKHCPGNAVKPSGGIDYRRCVSYITQSPGQPENIGRWVYGCDVCQDVCPFNKTRQAEYKADESRAELYYPDLEKLIAKDAELFGELSQSAAAWVGNERLARNAACVKV